MTLKELFSLFKKFLIEIKKQDFGFLMACFYLIFSYIRPQAIYPWLDVLPWTQLCIVLGFMYQIINKRLKFRIGYLLIFSFCIVVTISCFNSYYPEQSFDKLDVIFIWLIEIVFFTNSINSLRQLKLIIGLFILILFKMSFFGARVWISRGFGFTDWGIAGPPGFFANSGEFSLLMAIYAVLAIGFVAGLKNRSIYLHIFSVTAVMTVLGASSRGGQIALLIGLIYLALAFKKISPKYIVIGCILSISAYNLLPEEQKHRFSTIGEDNTSLARLKYWEAGLEIIDKHKLTGIGFMSFPYYYQDYYKSQSAEESPINRREVSHNSFIEVGSATGYPGLLIYILILLYINRLCKKTISIKDDYIIDNLWVKKSAIGLKAALIVYLIGSLFMSIAFYPYIYLIFMFSVVLYENAYKLIDQSKSKNKKLKISLD